MFLPNFIYLCIIIQHHLMPTKCKLGRWCRRFSTTTFNARPLIQQNGQKPPHIMIKQLFSTLFFCMVLLSSISTVFAAKESVRIDAFKAMEIRIYKASTENAFRLAVGNPSGDKFTIKVRNAKNELIWWSDVNDSVTYTKLIGMGKLTPGDYDLEISNDQTTYHKNITVK
jgi:hypothetical protein